MKVVYNDRGSALLIALCVMLVLFAAVIISVDEAIVETELSFNQLHSDKAFYVALAGIEKATAELDEDATWRTGFVQEQFDQGVYTVVVLDSTMRPALMDTVLVRSVGEEDCARSILELLLLEGTYHPLYNHAIYAGNYTEYDPSLDSQLWVTQMSFGGSGLEKDVIAGDIHFNGHLDFSAESVLDGSAYAGGDYTGNVPTGSVNANEDYLEPPDLLAENYETTADYYIGSSSPWDANGWIPASDPRHIFVKEFRPDLADSIGYTFDNTNYFFGDPYEGINCDLVSVGSSGNQKTYFVDGNLWVEPQGTISQLINSPAEGTQITVVVKGNIYFSDNLSYDNNDKDGLAFIAMTDGESYSDENGNSQYDAGEPILHDDGDGVYEGPSEGSGNIRFGDPNGGPLGDIHGFLYAENNFEDYVLDGPDGTPQDFSVTGSLSAGNHLNIQRDFVGGHSRMVVTYDDRLRNGTLSLPGLPKRDATESSGWVRVGWREL